MNKDPLNFGASGIFGRMGQNPSINALTNANAIASQQQAMGNSMMAKPDMSQQIMTGSFDPLTQQVGMGIFGDQNARNMAVRGSGIMMHGDKFRDRAKKLSEGSEQGDYDYDNPRVVKLLEKAKKADESHEGSPAKSSHVKADVEKRNKDLEEKMKVKKPRTRLMSGQQKDAAKVRNVVNAVKSGVKGFLNK